MFLHLFNRESVYIGYELSELNSIPDCLAANRIKYKYKVRSRMSQNSGLAGSMRGHVGSGPFSDYEYEVFVHKRDGEEAAFVIRRMREN